jgi:AraC-like DNA-binding protein
MVAQHFMLYLFNRTDFFSMLSYKLLTPYSNPELCRWVCQEMHSIDSRLNHQYAPFETTPLFMVLLKEFIQDAFMAEDFLEERKSTLVLRLLQLIEHEYRNPRLLDRLMETSSYGYSHTANLFRQYTGQAMKSYIIERRLEASKAVIMQGGSVADGAAAAGYEDAYYFSRIFRKYAGCPPREFNSRI